MTHRAGSTPGLQPIGARLPRALEALTRPQTRLFEAPSGEEPIGILYQHSVLCQTSLPYRNPGDQQRRWSRRNGFLKLEIDAGRAFDARAQDFIDLGLPYGPKPRLVLYHLNAEALRTQSPIIDLERTLAGFVKRTLGLDGHGRNFHTVRDQLTRLAACDFRIGKAESGTSLTVQGHIIAGLRLWTPDGAPQRTPWPTQVQFSAEYFESLVKHAVPLNESAVARLSHTAMGLDIYAWLAQRLHRIGEGTDARVSWGSLAEQFGGGYAEVREFRRVFKHTLAQVLVVYPDAKFDLTPAGMTLKHSRPPVPRRLLAVGG